jgi:transcriptional regulator with XRE-family HTH domain
MEGGDGRSYAELMTALVHPHAKVGDLLKEWRVRRRRSQMDVALDVGVSARHLSFVETGRSMPSPELLLSLADHLDVPLRDRNVFLLAAGYAPRYAQTSLDDSSMKPVVVALRRLLDGHDPYPGVVIDRSWNVVLANTPAARLTDGLPDDLTTPTVNVFRLCLHPDGLATRTRNFDEWGRYLLDKLERLQKLTNDPAVTALLEEVRGYPTVSAFNATARTSGEAEFALLVPWSVELGGVELSFFTTLTTFGTPRDITLDEVAVELFYPADERTAKALVELGGKTAERL